MIRAAWISLASRDMFVKEFSFCQSLCYRVILLQFRSVMCIHPAFTLSLWAMFVFSIPVANAQPTDEKKSAGEKFKNVFVLSDMPAR